MGSIGRKGKASSPVAARKRVRLCRSSQFRLDVADQFGIAWIDPDVAKRLDDAQKVGVPNAPDGTETPAV